MRAWAGHLAIAIAALLGLFSGPAAAGDTVVAQFACSAGARAAEPLRAVLADHGRWRCGDIRPSLLPERMVLTFRVPAGQPAPDRLVTRAHLFAAVTVALAREGRILGERSIAADAIMVGGHGDTVGVPLPAAARAGDTVLVAFDLPTTPGLFTNARLIRDASGFSWDEVRALLFAALVGGLLLMPLAFHGAYYRVLREPFMLWYLAISAALAVQCFLNSGIIGLFVAVPLPLHAALGTGSFGSGVAAAAAFGAAFIEPRKLHPALRRAMYGCAITIAAATALHIAVPMWGRPWQTTAYYLIFAPALALFAVTLVDAWRRGSRAVRYQVVAWSPFLLMGAIRIVTMAVPTLKPADAMGLFYVAMVIQSIATSMGVADRLVFIRRQRDRALTRAQSLERLSERDDLTGLYNRRALDGALGDFARQGFTGFALFDLDHFKRVNDTHGHAVGDAVLRVTASVLDGHENAVALRMGGEEFLLLLRGGAVAERVERLREALPVRIAREVEELQTLVTASTGLVEGADGIGSDFPRLYQTADELLYEAKHSGRNMLAAVSWRASSEPVPAAFAAA